MVFVFLSHASSVSVDVVLQPVKLCCGCSFSPLARRTCVDQVVQLQADKISDTTSIFFRLQQQMITCKAQCLTACMQLVMNDVAVADDCQI